MDIKRQTEEAIHIRRQRHFQPLVVTRLNTNDAGLTYLAPVIQRLDTAVHRMSHYPVDNVICHVDTSPLERDLPGG